MSVPIPENLLKELEESEKRLAEMQKLVEPDEVLSGGKPPSKGDPAYTIPKKLDIDEITKQIPNRRTNAPEVVPPPQPKPAPERK
jgi:hypothetical protein